MQARINHPVMVFPAAMKALIALSSSTGDTLPESTRNLIHLRASQINGCAVCLEMHAADMRKAGEPDERLFTVAGWRDAAYFSDAERAALALTEATTRLADRADAVPDEVWDEAAKHYDEQQLAALVITIASINTWNRLNAATRAVAGSLGG
ncbi:carboxymuconolactone decarboxylase family protein [Micromonospora sp. NBC_01796]|uniref:carboxymuconolactone decarboxylase family protein n=1 Tax=Micromonospora sp. NBC_01796 TaxID=2975987 RepID=UPI002DD84CE4|nr:carboxymuconolactone decarboxylase family protein [Micromonospora sp. NBC_01796]WSA85183.1 carboxymuconolactone decarboxylase family protein [Micromonospora sp. NBC_01796]